MIEVLEKGPDDETLIPFAKSMSKIARMGTSGSTASKNNTGNKTSHSKIFDIKSNTSSLLGESGDEMIYLSNP